MSIVLNEHEWAKEMIAERSLGKKPFETLCRVSRYYIDNGLSKMVARRKLDAFLLQCEPTASLTKWSDTLDAAVARSAKYDAIDIESINITKPEMEKIDSLSGQQIRRLAFALLCLAKYWDEITNRQSHWVNTKDSDIMRMANIKTSIKRQSQMYHALMELGLIQLSRKVDNTNVQVCFISTGEVVMRVTDFRNLGYQYMLYHGGPFFECQNCGITAKYDNPKSVRRQKYCKECAAEIDMQLRINSVMRMRSKERESKCLTS